jgi:lysophospholipid acyltransferase (LPLAT)-like uncharacterized protein
MTSAGSSTARASIGWLLGWVVAGWLRSLRLRVVDDARELVGSSRRPWVLVFFHGTQVPLLAWPRRRRTAVLVSLSRDGDLQAQVMARAGMHVVRGSSSRGAVRGLASIVRVVRSSPDEMDVAFAVDGPRGPYGTVHGGAAACARSIGGHLVPMGTAVARAKVLSRAWDRFSLPWPFTRAVVVVGEPLPEGASSDDIARAIVAANQRAQAILDAENESLAVAFRSIVAPRSE